MEQKQNLNKQYSYNNNNLSILQNNFDCRNLYLYEYLKPGTINQHIQLNSKEQQIFSIIKGILIKYNKKTVCRVAGGWVRDKLLGKDNYDIDIALDDMPGEQLAKLINDELYPGEEKFGIVSQNCEKSKHLETATMKICDTFIDFVNLRSEKYTEQSRVPLIDIGTPEEDARRRDITINALFYNINTETVEDFLNTGVTDLINGQIKTPLDPEVTFTDDPLRILRVVRFAVRLQFHLDEIIEKAAMKAEIKSALYKKISNERIAKELCLMLEGNKPQCAIYLLYKLNLLDAVMKLPLGIAELEAQQESLIIAAVNLVLVGSLLVETERFSGDSLFFNKFVFKRENMINNNISCNFKETKKLFFLSLLTLPFRNFTTKIGKENLRASVVIIRDSLKLPNDYMKEIIIINENITLLSDFINNSNGKFDRLTSSRIVRKVKSAYLHKLAVICVCNDYKENTEQNNPEVLHFINEELLLNVISKYQTWYNFLEQENLISIDTLEPLVKGDKIVQLLGVTGKDIGVLIEALIEEQIVIQNLTYEDAVEFLKLKKDELKLDTTASRKNKKK